MANLEFTFTPRGADAVVRDLTKVDQRLGSVENSLREFDAAQKVAAANAAKVASGLQSVSRSGSTLAPIMAKLGRENREMGRHMGQTVNQVSEMALGFGAMNPALREASLLFATAGNSASTMGAAFGPIGVAVAGLGFALPALIGALSDTEEELKDVGEAAKTAAERLDELITVQRKQREETDRETRVRAGRGTAEEQAAAITREEQRLQKIIEEQERWANAVGVTEERVRRTDYLRVRRFQVEQRIRTLREFRPDESELRGEQVTADQREREQEELFRRTREEIEAREERERRRREREGQESEAERRRRIRAEQGELYAGLANPNMQRPGGEETVDLDAMYAQSQASFEKDVVGRLAEEEAARGRIIEAIDKQNEGMSKAVELTEEQVELIGKFGAVGQQAGELVVAAIEGQGVAALKAFLEQTKRQNAVWAIEETAKGIAAAIFAPADAANHFAAAALHASLATGAGVAAANVSTGGGRADASPLRDDAGSSRDSAGTTVINVNAPFGTKAEVGEAVHQAMKEARREGRISREAA